MTRVPPNKNGSADPQPKGKPPTFKRVNYGRGHGYKDGNGNKIPGVTTILGAGLAKPALMAWGIKSVAQYAIDHWDDLAAKPVSARLEELKGSPYADRDAAANRGTEVHSYAERLMRGEEVTPPDAIRGHVESYVKFLDEWEPEPVLVEASVANFRVGYAGSLDMVVKIPKLGDGLFIADIKTSRSGIFGEVAFQLAAYANAEWYLKDGEMKYMPEIDRGLAIHVRADGYDVYELPIGREVFRQFEYIAQVAKAVELAKDYVGAPLRVEESK